MINVSFTGSTQPPASLVSTSSAVTTSVTASQLSTATSRKQHTLACNGGGY